jgi:hypothetical protein
LAIAFILRKSIPLARSLFFVGAGSKPTPDYWTDLGPEGKLETRHYIWKINAPEAYGL